MRDSFTLDEIDLAVINVMQIAPRATWKEVGKVLGISAATAARRWAALTTHGIAWVTAYPSLSVWSERHFLAFIEVDCEPSDRGCVVDALVEVPQVVSISQVASGRDLFLTLLVPDLQSLSRFTLDHISQLPGVRGTRTYTATHFYSEGSKWRLRALSPAQRGHLTRYAPSTPASAGGFPDACRDLLLHLSADGRRTIAELAELTATSVATTRRRLERLIRDGLVSLRCDISDSISGWPVCAHLWARVPPNDLDRIAQTLLTLPEIRMCAAITGTDNLLVVVWLRSLADSQRLESRLAERYPTLTLTERAIVMRTTKRMGHILDTAGRTTHTIPVNPWAELPSEPGGGG
ncbi:Lrp/AsnC family transcriptional regulator [Streptomyces tubercidicus]|uniref:AsnC family transcriptional regulator n=1 Tax=Streptomyces tubercidicus TaxID=47759 RepID=A0A640V3Q0_9ACTN|nr:Lrp/AsnC family transcriptional regulator [Streptomyces tubercidicus]WAU15710.1 Lrp/AsnC family transcriptional regulator [Streptomyces tubercidicus]GFE41591.1 AsnC family transcriptional regulator [Streptomyces tubercidicus]